MTQRSCGGGGCVVPADGWLPEDPREYFGQCLGVYVGCNQLVCERCRRKVRSVIGNWDGAARLDAGLLYEEPVWRETASPSERRERLYSCACHAEVVRAPGAMGPDEDALDFDTPRWLCGGHPGLKLPGSFAGFAVTHSTDWTALVATHLTREATSGLDEHLRKHPGFLLTRLYLALEEPHARDRLSRAVAANASCPDPAARISVALFFAQNPLAAGFDTVLSAWRADPGLYGDHPVNWGPIRDLRGVLQEALGFRIARLQSRGAQDESARDALRWAALTPPGLRAQLFWLPDVDAEWAEENVEKVLAAHPAEWQAVLLAKLAQRTERIAVVCKLAMRLAGASRNDVLDTVEDVYFQDVRNSVARELERDR